MPQATEDTTPIRDNEHDEHDDSLEPKVWTGAIFVAALGLYGAGNTRIALVFAGIGLLYVLSGSFFKEMTDEDKLRIEYNIYSADDCYEDVMKKQRNTSSFRTAVLALLPALAKKYAKLQAKKKENGDDANVDTIELAMADVAHTAQKAVYLALGELHDDDEVVTAAFALLALISKEDSVKERHYLQADKFGLHVLVHCMQNALERAKAYNQAHQEQSAAELQRKGCLLLGALADKNPPLAAQIVREGGIDAIAQALSWFRHHADVCNWALWALFTLCYEHGENKLALVDHAPLIVETLRNCPASVDVARHGTALVFDLLRSDDHDDPRIHNRAREMMIAVGLEQVMRQVTEKFVDASDIQMMGKEILGRAR